MLKFAGSIARYPARVLFFYYLGAIVLGGLLLAAPFSLHEDRRPISFVDAFFTATSAVCVTGLSVRSTVHDFSITGQVILLVLIQLGGIGIMTVTTFVMVLMTGQENLRSKATLAETLGAGPLDRMIDVGLRVLFITLFIEAVGALILYGKFLTEDYPHPLWKAIFYSVSAFCNAGFAFEDRSLETYHADYLVNFVVMGLIVVGGLGFPVLIDLWHSIGDARKDKRPVCFLRRYWSHLLLTSKIVVLGTLVLIVVGMSLILSLEWHRALAEYPVRHKLLIGLFQSVTTRTAGFSSIDLATFNAATIFVMMLWMFVGSAPCSTGGGAKVTTIFVLILQAWYRLRGYQNIVLFRRTIPRETVERSMMIVMLFITFIVLGLFGILVAGEGFLGASGTSVREQHDYFMKVCFEVVSALCTVGLSLGITAELSDWSKVCLIVLMFVGRIGPIAVVLTIARSIRDPRLKPANQEVLTG